jgi:hypothetical protein
LHGLFGLNLQERARLAHLQHRNRRMGQSRIRPDGGEGIIMQLKVKKQEDLWAGLIFVGFGVLTMVVCRNYPMGSNTNMGPGYLPMYTGAILTILGVIISLMSFRIEGERIKPFAWRGMIMLTIGFAAFGWSVDHIGFVPGLLALIFCSAWAGKEFKLLEVLVMSAVLIIGSVALFVFGLKLPFSLFWWK